MKLHYTDIGQGEPLVILHGLYGSSDNWFTIGRELAEHFRIILVDQRNHGRSPHHPVMDYPSMASDILELLHDLGIEKSSLLGHSMGGKTAMVFSFQYPQRVTKLVVVDISPLGPEAPDDKIRTGHRQIVEGLLALPLANISSRRQADEFIAPFVKSPQVRQFLLKSLKRGSSSSFHWQFNLQAIGINLDSLMGEVVPPSAVVTVPALFVRGALSDHLPERAAEAIGKRFHSSTHTTIPNAGHWLHAEQPALFTAVVRAFLGGKE